MLTIGDDGIYVSLQVDFVLSIVSRDALYDMGADTIMVGIFVYIRGLMHLSSHVRCRVRLG